MILVRAAFFLLTTSLAGCGSSVVLETGTSGAAVGSTGAGGSAASSSSDMEGSCGNAVPEPTDHCDDPTSLLYCTKDCLPGGEGGAGGNAACPGPFYAGKYDGAGSRWSLLPNAGGEVGLVAGNNQCAAMGTGADHVCDYEEVLLAFSHGELTGIPKGTTAWVQRSTPAIVGGELSAPGLGGNCIGWTFDANHIADGEYITFEQAGAPTFHLDNDTIFDQQNPHVTGDLQCGGAVRSILCCYPTCTAPSGG